MSRTDKDRPYRVRARDARRLFEHHSPCCRRGRRPCDIDAGGIRTRCFRSSDWPMPFTLPRCREQWAEYRNWTRPDRQRARLSLRRALRDYNAHGDTEIEPPMEQHRHRGRYDCW